MVRIVKRLLCHRQLVRPCLEALEDRCLPSTVMNLNDSGPGSLRDAIASTPSGGTVDFQPGLSGTLPLTSGELAIGKDLTIAGPGAGVLTVSGSHAWRVFDIAGAFTVGIAGLTVADGVAPGPDYRGGGIYNNGGTLTVTDSTLSGNAARKLTLPGGGSGGAIYNGGTLTVTDSTLSGNTVFAAVSGISFGGCIYNGGTLTVTDSTLSGNHADGPFSGLGGCIYNGGTMTVTASTLSGNSVHFGYGGGIYNAGTVTVTASTLYFNTAADEGGFGGCINNAFGGTMTVTASTLSVSSADDGGCIYNRGTLTLTSSTLSGGSAHDTGGIYNRGTVTVTASTLSGNSADIYGGISNGYGDTVTVTNTILAGNHARFYGPDGSGGFTDQGHNLFGTALQGSGGPGDVFSDNPLLQPLGDYGGPTKTMALLPGSPALDAGSDSVLGPPLNLTTDQRGLPRKSGAHVDIGAYEAQAPAITSADNTTFTVGTGGTFTLTATGDPALVFTASGTLPSGVSFTDNHDGTATLAGTPAVGAGGIYLVTLTASNGFAPDAVQTFTLTVIETPAIDIGVVISQVANLSGLNDGQKNSLESKLQAALQSLAQGNTNAAINQLNAFLNEVQALKGSNRLDAETADLFLGEIQTVIALLE
jgi:hypothetical protein